MGKVLAWKFFGTFLKEENFCFRLQFTLLQFIMIITLSQRAFQQSINHNIIISNIQQ